MPGSVFAKSYAGFTLIELVIVIVLLGVISVASTQFIRQGTEIYIDSARRDKLQQQGRFAVERMSRELRNALPGSIRVGTDPANPCIEFIPVQAASTYLQPVANTAISSLNVVDFSYAYSSGDVIAIYPIDTTSVYASPSAMGALTAASAASGGQQTLTLTAKQFPHESPTRRFYIVRSPVSFCAIDDELRRYAGYTQTVTQVSPPVSGGVLLAEKIRLSENSIPVPVFSFTSGTLQRAGLAQMDLRFSDQGEWLYFSQEIFVRNTP